MTALHDFPPAKKFVEDCYSHDLEKLLRAAGLTAQRDADVAANSAFEQNWDVVKDWSERSRYERHSQLKAQKLYDAITHPADGVFPWIQVHW